MAQSSPLIGLLEDDPSMRFLMRSYLEKSGFRVQASATAVDFFVAFERERPDCLLIDLGLPDEDGLVVVRKIRYLSDLPLFIVSARQDERDRLAGIELGADDYITKPFHPRELVARIHNQLRRHAGTNAPTWQPAAPETDGSSSWSAGATPRFFGFTLDPGKRSLTNHHGQPVTLTRGEFDALATLLRAGGNVVTRERLKDAISRRPDPPSDRGINAVICRIRRKLDPLGKWPALILTVPGHGYRLNDQLLASSPEAFSEAD